MAIDKQALRALSYGLYIVTSKEGERLNGQIANVVFQVTSTPLNIAVALNKENLTPPVFGKEWRVCGIRSGRERPSSIHRPFWLQVGQRLG